MLCTCVNTWAEIEAVLMAVQVALKCADIGHLAASPEVHKRWALLLEKEFFLQVSRTAGDKAVSETGLPSWQPHHSP